MNVLSALKRVSPNRKHIKLDKKRAQGFPDLLNVLECHTRSIDYMIPFFKEPLIENCSCKGCTNGIIKVVRIPRTVYDKVMELPMSMPVIKPSELWDKSTDLEYLSFTEAQRLPFTNKYQPSLEPIPLRAAARKKKTQAAIHPLAPSQFASDLFVTKLKRITGFPIGIAVRVRGVVECKKCSKLRCIYSLAALAHMKPSPRHLTDNHITSEVPCTYEEVQHYMTMAKGRLIDAMESSIFIFGMAPLDHDYPCYNIFLCDLSQDCDSPLEPDFYMSKIQPKRLEL